MLEEPIHSCPIPYLLILNLRPKSFQTYSIQAEFQQANVVQVYLFFQFKKPATIPIHTVIAGNISVEI